MSFFIAQYYDKLGYFHVFLLINEAISIVSGVDSIFLEENKKYESMLCKKYIQKSYCVIIQHLRAPREIISQCF
jgi:hypothetical protein